MEAAECGCGGGARQWAFRTRPLAEDCADPVIALGESIPHAATRRLAVSVLDGLLGRLTPPEQARVREAVVRMQLPGDQGLAEAIATFGSARVFIVAASFLKRADAVARAQEVGAKLPAPRTAEVRQLAGKGAGGYVVVCVGPLALTDAVDVRAQLVSTGAAPRDAWLVATNRLMEGTRG